MTHLRNAGGDAANGLQRIILGSGISGKPYAAAALLLSITSSEFFSHFFQRKMPQTVVRSKGEKIDFILFFIPLTSSKNSYNVLLNEIPIKSLIYVTFIDY